MRVFRSLAFVPGRAELLRKAARKSRPGAFVLDLEDSVAWPHKAAARAAVADFVRDLPRSPHASPAYWVRVNSTQSALFDADLEALLQRGEARGRVLGLSVGKVESATHLAEIVARLEAAERRAGPGDGEPLLLLPWLESAAGVADAHAICALAHTGRLGGVAFGLDDYLADLALSLDDADERHAATQHARACVALAANAHHVPAYESPFVDFRNPDGLRRYARRARLLGFKGQFAIHPAQVAVLEESFAPTAKECERARAVVDAYEAAAADGRGSTSIDGQMIDHPVYLRNKATLAQCDAAGTAPEPSGA